MKVRMWFEKGNWERCYELDYFEDRIFDGEKEIHLIAGKKEYGSGVMWCQEYGEIVESGDGACGIICKDYNPCNGKSGRCRHLKNCYNETDKEYLLTKEGLSKLTVG